jgi:hypothetical protein
MSIDSTKNHQEKRLTKANDRSVSSSRCDGMAPWAILQNTHEAAAAAAAALPVIAILIRGLIKKGPGMQLQHVRNDDHDNDNNRDVGTRLLATFNDRISDVLARDGGA